MSTPTDAPDDALAPVRELGDPLDHMLPDTYRRRAPQPAGDPTPRGPSRRTRRRRHRAARDADRAKRTQRSTLNKTIRRSIAVVLAVALVSLGWSIGNALVKPGNDPLNAKLVEWVRDHGGNHVVDRIENWWYSHHQPQKGGKPKGGKLPHAQAPKAALPHSTTTTAPPQFVPANIPPIAHDPLPNEGVWAPTGKLVAGRAAIYQTYLRPDPVHTSLVTGVAWMDTNLLRATLYNGLQLPGGGPWIHGAKITTPDYPSLVAGFNSAFKLDVSKGGYYTEGKTVRPLVNGRASLVIDSNGTPAVDLWGRDAQLAPNIVSVRQNLDLLVDHGQNLATGDARDTYKWGATLGNKVYVWRSGIGQDAHGNLIYAGGPGLNITTLADVLLKAGAVRAMELDINTAWVSFFSYLGGDSTGPLHGVKLLDNMDRSPDSYLQGNSRDFVAMFAR